METKTEKNIISNYKINWIASLIGAGIGFFIVKKGIKSNNIMALGAGVLIGSLIGSHISIKKSPKVVIPNVE